MIIGFTHNTSKRLARIFCRRFRHCAVIFEPIDTGDGYLMIQIASDGIKLINMRQESLTRLEQHGWVFVRTNVPGNPAKMHIGLLTCVGFAKRALGIRNIFIQTPYGLYRRLTKK